MSGGRDWTTTELAIVRRHYPLGGTTACVALLPGRSKHAIQRVAHDNGIRFSSGPWSARELAVLRRHYPAGGWAACLPLLPGRTRTAIMRAAYVHGLRWRKRGPARSARRTPSMETAAHG